MLQLKFCNNGVLSPLDLISMGDSSKRGDSTTFGTFDSGLKYAIALLLRNDIHIEIKSGGSNYTFGTVHKTLGGKTKELIVVYENDIVHETGFAVNLGFNWELWMAFRELYSNMLDEGGRMFLPTESSSIEYDTVISIDVNDTVQGILDNWNNYFITNEEPIISNESVKVYENPGGVLRFYKNGILILEDRERYSVFKYDYLHASIDEMRTLNDENNLRWEVDSCISKCTDLDFIQRYLTELEVHSKTTFEDSFCHNYLSSEWISTANNLRKKGIPFLTTNALFKAIATHRDSDIGTRYIPASSDYFASKVKVVEVEVKEESFIEKISNLCSSYGIEVDFKICESTISSYKALSDSYSNTIYISSTFTEDDMWELVRAWIRLKYPNNDSVVYQLLTEKMKNK